ncbi:MAG: hypothetical protein IKM31_07750 [Oscillospiraceae bacterium]|nr:hypothetical protein [Oscillospiraceae bacterium]
MDVIVEYIVKRKNTGKDLILQILILIASVTLALVLLAAGFLILPSLMPILTLLAMGAIYGGYLLFTQYNVEYEYIFVNGEMDIDKIIARRKRKRLVTVNARHFESFGIYKAAEHANVQYANRIYACGSMNDPGNFYAVVNHARLGRTLLVFSPNDRILNALKTYIPRQVGGNAAYGARPDAH